MTGTWRKASRSSTQTNCVEVAPTGVVRDSKNPAGPTLPANLCALLTAIKSGRLDRA